MHGMFIFPAINCHQKMAVEMGRMTVETGGKFTAVITNSDISILLLYCINKCRIYPRVAQCTLKNNMIALATIRTKVKGRIIIMQQYHNIVII
jgi:hypothetical protein